MAYSLADLTTRTRDLLNEASAAFYSDAQIQRWLGDAAADISVTTRSYELTTTFNLATSTVAYAVPTDSLEVMHLRYAATNIGLVRTTPTMSGHIISETTSALPMYWYEFAGYVNVDPVPTSGANGLTVTVFYAKMTQDVTLLSYSSQIACAYYAAAMGKLKDKSPGEASVFWSMYINAIGFRRADIFARDPNTRQELTLADEAVSNAR